METSQWGVTCHTLTPPPQNINLSPNFDSSFLNPDLFLSVLFYLLSNNLFISRFFQNLFRDLSLCPHLFFPFFIIDCSLYIHSLGGRFVCDGVFFGWLAEGIRKFLKRKKIRLYTVKFIYFTKDNPSPLPVFCHYPVY